MAYIETAPNEQGINQVNIIGMNQAELDSIYDGLLYSLSTDDLLRQDFKHMVLPDYPARKQLFELIKFFIQANRLPHSRER